MKHAQNSPDLYKSTHTVIDLKIRRANPDDPDVPSLTISEVDKATRLMKTNKSPRIDYVTSDVLAGGEIITPETATRLNRVLTQKIPFERNETKIIILHKKGKK